MTSSIPEFLNNDEVPAVQPSSDRRATDESGMPFEQWAVGNLRRELDKVPVMSQPPDAFHNPRVTGHDLPEARKAPAPDVGDLLELLPKTIELLSLVQEQRLLMEAIQKACEANHREIHSLQARLARLESRNPARMPAENPSAETVDPQASSSPDIATTDDEVIDGS